MLKTCVLVADRSRARLFVTMVAPDRVVGQAGLELRELESLVAPEGELTGNEVFSNARSGSNRAPHGAAFEYDDHRERHREEVERRFAKRVATAARQLVEREAASRLVLAVEPHMLGLVRQELPESLPGIASRVELPRDFSWHTPQRILEALEQSGAIATAAG